MTLAFCNFDTHVVTYLIKMLCISHHFMQCLLGSFMPLCINVFNYIYVSSAVQRKITGAVVGDHWDIQCGLNGSQELLVKYLPLTDIVWDSPRCIPSLSCRWGYGRYINAIAIYVGKENLNMYPLWEQIMTVGLILFYWCADTLFPHMLHARVVAMGWPTLPGTWMQMAMNY